MPFLGPLPLNFLKVSSDWSEFYFSVFMSSTTTRPKTPPYHTTFAARGVIVRICFFKVLMLSNVIRYRLQTSLRFDQEMYVFLYPAQRERIEQASVMLRGAVMVDACHLLDTKRQSDFGSPRKAWGNPCSRARHALTQMYCTNTTARSSEHNNNLWCSHRGCGIRSVESHPP